MNAIPISQAFFCCDCDLVLDQARLCPRCASGLGIASLGAWLNRVSVRELVASLDHISAVRSGGSR